MYRFKQDNLLTGLGIVAVLMADHLLQDRIAIIRFRDIPVLQDGDPELVAGVALWGLVLVTALLVIKTLKR